MEGRANNSAHKLWGATGSMQDGMGHVTDGGCLQVGKQTLHAPLRRGELLEPVPASTHPCAAPANHDAPCGILHAGVHIGLHAWH